MPRADIKTKQAINTLSQLHAELAGKFLANHRECIRLKTCMMQVEAVMQMLQPGFSVAGIAAKRRNRSNPWFKRGTPRKQFVDLQAAIHCALRKRAGGAVVGEGTPARWRLNEAAN
jgi:hypothetical protein